MLYALIFLVMFRSSQATPPQAPPIEKPDQAPLVIDHVPAPPKPKPTQFPPWSNEIAKMQKPTVVFVGTPARTVDGMVVCYSATLPGANGPCVVVSLPSKVNPPVFMAWIVTLPVNATDSQIRRAAGLDVSQSAVPFVPLKSGAAGSTVQPDRRGDGSAGLRFHAGHSCPSCGAGQTVISGVGPVRGTHTHTCPRCKTTWYH